MPVISKIVRFLRDTRGVAAVEFAFIVPFLIIVYLGLYDLVTLIMTNRKVTYSASVVADLVTQAQTNITKSQVDDYFKAAELVMRPVPMSKVKIEVYGYKTTAGTPPTLNPTPDWTTSGGSGGGCGGAPSTTGFDKLITAGNDLVLVRTCSTFTPWLANFMGSYILGSPNFAINQQTAQRPRAIGAARLTCWATTIGGAKCS